MLSRLSGASTRWTGVFPLWRRSLASVRDRETSRVFSPASPKALGAGSLRGRAWSRCGGSDALPYSGGRCVARNGDSVI
jgi:hypothetical protein